MNLDPPNDTKSIPRVGRDPTRQPSLKTKLAALKRDGYRCRYCGIPVVSAEVRKQAQMLYPDAVRWADNDERAQHAAFQCFWLQFDHVIPHSHGGSSQIENIVVTCYLCNFGKDKFTVKQLGLSDPRLRPPAKTNWDGLERFGAVTSAPKGENNSVDASVASSLRYAAKVNSPSRGAYFIPNARISNGYLYTPPIGGKQRWFKLSESVYAEYSARSGISGCTLICSEADLARRGITLQELAE